MSNKATLTITPHQQSPSCVALTLYLGNLAPSGRRSMRSLLQQVATLNKWVGPLEHMPWLTLRYENVATIRAALRQANKSANTINTTLAAIRGVLKAGFLLGQFPILEWQRIQAIDSVKGKHLQAGRCLSNREVTKLLHTCQKSDSVEGVRASVIIALMAYTGLRRSELVALDVFDYNQRNGHLCIRSGKGQKQRELSVPKEARNFIRRWLKIRGHEAGPLLCKLTKSGDCLISQRLNAQSAYYVIKKGAHQAGLKSCSPHDLRRTFVTCLLEQGVDLNTTRQLAGHEQIQTTLMYDRRSTKSQKLAMANFHI